MTTIFIIVILLLITQLFINVSVYNQLKRFDDQLNEMKDYYNKEKYNINPPKRKAIAKENSPY